MQTARVAIVSSNKELAETLLRQISEQGYASSIVNPDAYREALGASRGPLLIILDPPSGKSKAEQIVSEARNHGAKTLLLSHLNGMTELDSVIQSRVDYSWPHEAIDALPGQLRTLLSENPNDRTPQASLLKSIYLSASAIANQRPPSAEALQRELEQANARIATMQKEMESFTYSVSHDLRAPLRAIDGFTRILLEDHAAQLDEEGKRFLNYVQTNSQQLSRLIDDLLVFHRLGKTALSSTNLDMTELFQAVIAEQRMLEKKQRPERSVQVDVPALLPAKGDPNLLRQAVAQLIGNAFKFSRLTEKPRIEISSHTENNQHVYCISDNGIGFDMQYESKLFQVFQKLQRQDEFEGNGIGLAVVHRIIQRHGGRVSAEGKPSEGAVFCFTLPA